MTTETDFFVPAQLLGVGVAEVSLETGRFERANRAICEMAGFGEAERREMSYQTLILPDDRPPDAERFQATSRGERQEDAPITCCRGKDGSVVYLHLHVTLVKDAGRVYNLAVVQDVSARETAEVQRRELAARLEQQLRVFEAVLSSLQDFVYLLDLGGRFVYVNPALLGLWGKTQAEALGKTFAELGYPPNLVALHTSQLDEVVATKRPVRGGNSYTNFEGRTSFYEYLFTPVFGADGAVTAIAGVTRDVTEQRRLVHDLGERKRTEEELHRAIQEVMSDTAWFSRGVLERLSQMRPNGVEPAPAVELTQRERQVLGRIAQGESNPQIAKGLGLAEQTVRNYTASVYEKLGVHSRAEAVVWARERGIIGP